jgi:hypothetical protein
MTVGDFLQNAAAANNKEDGAGGGAGGNGGGAGLDLNALAGLLQRPFVPSVPGSIGADTNNLHQQPGTDAYGNQVEQPPQGQAAGTSMMGEQEQKEEQEEKKNKDEVEDAQSQHPMGLGDAFYDQAASQLLSHSGSNFKKMQAVVNQIMAEEGFGI